MDIPFHVINLENRKDRKDKLIENFQKYNITNYTFHTAVHGVTLNLEELEANGTIDYSAHRKLTRGEYGCFLSHMNVMKFILDRPEEQHLILEDDVFFVKYFESKFNYLLDKINDIEWDIFYIGINGCHPEMQFVGNRRDGIYCLRRPLWGTHAYVIKKTTVRKIVNQFIPITLPIDVFLMNMDLRRFTLINTIVKTYKEDSDTQSIK